MGKDLNIEITATGVNVTNEKLKGLGKTGKKVGEEIQQGSQKGKEGLEGLDQQSKKTERGLGSFVKSIGDFKTKIFSAVGIITTLIGILKIWLDYLNKIAAAQREIAEQAKSLDSAAKALASQAGIMSTEGGIAASREQIIKIMQGGNLSDVGLAEGIAVSTHSAFGTKGQALTDSQVGIASTVADFAQRKGISASGADQLFKVLAAMDVSDQASAQSAIQKISSVQQASKAKTFEQFITGGVKSLIPAMAMGASPERALADFATTLNASSSAEEGATTASQLSRLLQSPDAIAGMTAGTGLSEVQFRNLPYDQKMGMLDQFLKGNSSTGEGQMYLQSLGLTEEQMKAAVTLYNPANVAARSNFMQLGRTSTAAEFAKESAGWRNTTLGQVETMDSQAAIVSMQATRDQRIGLAIKNLAEKHFQQYKAAGLTSILATDKKDQQNEIIFKPLWEEFIKTTDGKSFINWTPEQKDMREKLIKLKRANLDSEVPVGTIGEVVEDFEQFTGKSATTVINNYMAPIYNRQDSGSPPRVSPTD